MHRIMISMKNIFTTFLVVGIFSLHPSLNKGPLSYLHFLVYGNHVNLSAEDVDLHQISVKWSCDNDQSNCKELVIYEHGKLINDIPYESGEQQVALYYNNRLIGTLKQTKQVKNQAHQYSFKVSSNKDLLKFSGEITGPSPSVFTKTISKKDILLAKL